VTCNHIHLLVKDTGPNVIAESMQLIAGRTAQEYNQRKGKQGAFWEDRYLATAVQADEHFHRRHKGRVFTLARQPTRLVVFALKLYRSTRFSFFGNLFRQINLNERLVRNVLFIR
jgi:REP element-mobilizing transposase RayT